MNWVKAAVVSFAAAILMTGAAEAAKCSSTGGL